MTWYIQQASGPKTSKIIQLVGIGTQYSQLFFKIIYRQNSNNSMQFDIQDRIAAVLHGLKSDKKSIGPRNSDPEKKVSLKLILFPHFRSIIGQENSWWIIHGYARSSLLPAYFTFITYCLFSASSLNIKRCVQMKVE